MKEIEYIFEQSNAGITIQALASITGKSETTCRRAVHALRRRKKIIAGGYTCTGATLWRRVERTPWHRRIRQGVRDYVSLRTHILKIRLFGVRY
jgi:hypothetical protein